MATIEKYRSEIEKAKTKIGELKKKVRYLEQKIAEEENQEIVRMVKTVKIDRGELSAFLKAYANGELTLPEGNLSLVDDIESAGSEDKQFITVTSKSGNTFYIIIIRTADEKNTVHFLNQVDDANLLALTEGKEPQTAPAVCTCTEKCEACNVKMNCEVCKNDRSGCVVKEPAAEEPKEKGELNPSLILLPLLLLGGGGAFYYFKFVKDKSYTQVNNNLKDYDFEDEYEDTEVEYLDDTPKEDESVLN